uniref:Uncharacterized protein n=1 Tax=Romanomermis culicivorax TaxID=13658 RepID=A0A915KL42_ROMCU
MSTPAVIDYSEKLQALQGDIKNTRCRRGLLFSSIKSSSESLFSSFVISHVALLVSATYRKKACQMSLMCRVVLS